MKPLAARPPKSPAKQSQDLIEQRVRVAFARVPLLLAVSFAQDLSLADVEVQPCPGSDWSDDVYSEVDAEISDLLGEIKHAGLSEQLRGRTFARALH